MHSFILACYAMFILFPERPVLFKNGNGGEMNLVERGGGKEDWEEFREGKLQLGSNV